MRIELDLPQDFLDLLSATGGIFYGDIKNRRVKAISTDSRECHDGDVFFALDGKNNSGNDYISAAIERGAIPVGRKVGRFGIRVDSGNDALLSFAAFYKNALPKLRKTIAITGSVGKTTTKEFLKILSKQRYKTHATWKNFNNAIGASFTVLSADKDTDILILEFGMNHAGEIKKLSLSFTPDIGVITKIGTAHIGFLGTKKEIAKAKYEIVSGLKGSLIIPKGEPLLPSEYRITKYFSVSDASTEFAILKNSFESVELYIDGELYSIFDFPQNEKHILECLAASVGAAIELGLSPCEITQGISHIENNSFRHKTITSSAGYTIIDDSYNASYESVVAAFSMIANRKCEGRRCVLLGDILELGNFSYSIHHSIGTAISDFGIDYVFLIGDYASAMYEGAINGGFNPKHIFNLNKLEFPSEVARFITSKLSAHDTLLIKASHGMNLNKITELIR